MLSDLEAQQEPASAWALSGDPARGPLAFSPNGQILVTGADGLSLQLRNATSGDLSLRVAVPKGVGRDIAISPDGKWAACAGTDGPDNVIWLPDQKLLASGQVEGTIKLMEVSTGAIVRQWHAEEQLRSLAISPDGGILATGHRKDVKLWKLETGELQDTLGGHGNWVGSLSFSADGKLLASASGDGAKLWHLADE